MQTRSTGGVFARGDDGHLAFQRLPAPDDDDVLVLLRQCVARVLRLLRRELHDDEPEVDALAALEVASLKARPAAGGEAPRPKRLTAFLEGFSLHAGVHLHANDRRGLEQLCRYGARWAWWAMWYWPAMFAGHAVLYRTGATLWYVQFVNLALTVSAQLASARRVQAQPAAR